MFFKFLCNRGDKDNIKMFKNECSNVCECFIITKGIMDNGRLVAEGSPAELMQKNNSSNLEDVFLTVTGKDLRD